MITAHPRRMVAACDGHHEMSDCDAAGEPVHSGAESIEPASPHQRSDGPFARLDGERSSTLLDLGRASQDRELRDDELDAVSGGNEGYPGLPLGSNIKCCTVAVGYVVCGTSSAPPVTYRDRVNRRLEICCSRTTGAPEQYLGASGQRMRDAGRGWPSNAGDRATPSARVGEMDLGPCPLFSAMPGSA